MDRLRVGLLILACAPLAWLALALLAGQGEYRHSLIICFAGLALLAWALPDERPAWAGAGFVIAAIGMGAFYKGDFLAATTNWAGGAFVVGCLLALFGLGNKRELLAAGFWLIAAAGLLWVIADNFSSFRWQLGNLAALAGSVIAALAARDS